MKLHKLKLTQPYFDQVKYHNGKVENFFKKFEVRKNDRDYQVGDLLLLLEYDPKTKEYLNDGYFTEINYILDLQESLGICNSEYVILGLNPICINKDGYDLLNNNNYAPFLNLTDEDCLKELLDLMEHKNVGCWEKWKVLCKKALQPQK